MAVSLPDSAAEAAEKLLDIRIKEIEPDHLLAIAFGEVQDDEFEAMRELRRSLREGAVATRPARAPTRARARARSSDDGEGNAIAIGRHAVDFLKAQELSAGARAALESANVQRTLVGLRVEPGVAKEFVEVLKRGADDTQDKLLRDRLSRAATRMGDLA